MKGVGDRLETNLLQFPSALQVAAWRAVEVGPSLICCILVLSGPCRDHWVDRNPFEPSLVQPAQSSALSKHRILAGSLV